MAVLSSFAALAAAHHERLDGRGYHRGIAMSGLPLDARILAVADVYDALTKARPYRDAMPVAEALALMRGDVGSAFCPVAFAALEHGAAEGRLEVLRRRPDPTDRLASVTGTGWTSSWRERVRC